MGLRFRNNTNLTVNIAFAYYTTSCNDGNGIPLILWPSWYEVVG